MGVPLLGELLRKRGRIIWAFLPGASVSKPLALPGGAEQFSGDRLP